MKTIILIFNAFFLLAHSCDTNNNRNNNNSSNDYSDNTIKKNDAKKYEWTVLYGEMNDNLSIREINGNYIYNNIEYFFIDPKTKNCYRNIDTNLFTKSESLIEDKIKVLQDNNINEQEYKKAKILLLNTDNFNVEFFDESNRQTIYKIKSNDTLNNNASVFIIYKNDTLPALWTDRKSKTTRSKKFIKKIYNRVER